MALEGLSRASKRMNILPTRTSFLAVSWGILLKMTIVIITIINIIITIIYYQYEGRYLSTFHACETHLGLSRTWQRMLLLPGRTSFWTSFGKFFWRWPLSWSQSSQLSSSSYSTSIREGVWALFMHVKPNSGSPGGHNDRSSSQRGPPFGRLLGNSFEDDQTSQDCMLICRRRDGLRGPRFCMHTLYACTLRNTSK